MKITKSVKSVTASEKIILTPSEKKELEATLRAKLDTISTYHEDLDPSGVSSLQDLEDMYYYWGEEYNDGYLGRDTHNATDKLSRYLIQNFKEYCGDYDSDINACGITCTSNTSNRGTAVQHIKAAIDILAKDAKKDEVKKDIIANLSVVMFDLMGSDM